MAEANKTRLGLRLSRSAVRIAGLTLASIFLVAIAGCGKSYTYKYRITVSVNDRGEVRSASGVVSVKEVARQNIATEPQLCGEAIPLPLKNGRYLFALLNGLPRNPVVGQFQWRDAPTGILLHRLGLQTEWSWEDDSGLLRLPETKQAFTLLSYEMPEFASLRDLSSPAMMDRVDPDNPEATLGEGVQIKSVTLQVTDENVTRGRIGQLLPWLSLWREYLDGSQRGTSVHGYKTIQFRNCVLFGN